MPLSLYGGRSSSCTYTSSPGRYRYGTSYGSTFPQYGTTGYAPGYAPGYTSLAQQFPGPWGTPVSPYFGTQAYNSPYMTSADPGTGMLIMSPGYPNNQLGVMGVPYNTGVDPRQSPYYRYQSYPSIPQR
ncbi:hypothetical protein F5887DRAFT_924658 [Amanita rubescens]|nr:hypothetical protein F5887DRAFT_924658 [Amanita rubescens]